MARQWTFVQADDGHDIPNMITTGVRRTPRGMPGSVRICGERWAVVYCTDLHVLRRKGKKIVRHKLYGFCMHTERLIVIETDCPRFEMIDTLFHEMGHAYMRHFAGKNKQILKQEETIVELFAKAMSDTVFNNYLPSETA